MQASRLGDVETVTALLGRGAVIAAEDSDGLDALGHAQGRPDIIELPMAERAVPPARLGGEVSSALDERGVHELGLVALVSSFLSRCAEVPVTIREGSPREASMERAEVAVPSRCLESAVTKSRIAKPSHLSSRERNRSHSMRRRLAAGSTPWIELSCFES